MKETELAACRQIPELSDGHSAPARPRLPEADGFCLVRSTQTQPGGSCTNVLTQLARLGARCAFQGAVGGDELGQAVHEIWIIYWIYPFTWTLSSIVYVISLRKLHIFSRSRAAAAAISDGSDISCSI